MSLARYVALVLAVVGAALVAAWPLLASSLDRRSREAVLCGAALACLNTILAHFLVLWSAGRSTKLFMGAVLGGMGGRMALMLGAVVVAILIFGLPKLPLAIGLLVFFVLFLVLELAILHRQTSTPAGGR